MPAAFARSSMNSVTAWLSFTGLVLGIAQTVRETSCHRLRPFLTESFLVFKARLAKVHVQID